MKFPVVILAVFASIAVTIDATVYFKEQFLDGGAVTLCLLVLCMNDCVVPLTVSAGYFTLSAVSGVSMFLLK